MRRKEKSEEKKKKWKCNLCVCGGGGVLFFFYHFLPALSLCKIKKNEKRNERRRTKTSQRRRSVCSLSFSLSLPPTPPLLTAAYIFCHFFCHHTHIESIDRSCVGVSLSRKVPKFQKILGTYRVNDAIDLQSVSRDQKCIQI